MSRRAIDLGQRPTAFPEFVARMPWWGGDLQTLRNYLVARHPEIPAHRSRRLSFPMTDGSDDRLLGVLDEPALDRPSPLVVLIHGLTGCEDSAYMRLSAAYFLARGWHVLRLSLRGAGPARAVCREQYHAGRTTDLRDALRALESPATDNGLVLVGYSLGGSMLLKFLAEFGAAFPIRAAATVSAPLDLAAAVRRMLSPRNYIYHRWLLNNMKTESLCGAALVRSDERAAIRAARSIYEFDDNFVGPRNGYHGAEDYYARNAAHRFVGQIEIPTLVVCARNDPWIRTSFQDEAGLRANRHLTVLLPDQGGHVGFHGAGNPSPWHDRCIGEFFERLTDGKASTNP